MASRTRTSWAEEVDHEEAEQKQAKKKLQQQQQEEALSLSISVSNLSMKTNPTSTISELVIGQHAGAKGRYRSIPDYRSFPLTNRNPRATSVFEPRSHYRRYEALPLSRADEVDNWSSGKKVAGVSLDQISSTKKRDDHRYLPSQGGRKSEASTLSKSREKTTEIRIRSDPFSGARPREEVLAAKCRDDSKTKEEEEDLHQRNSPKAFSIASMVSSSIETKIDSPINTCTHQIDEIKQVRVRSDPFAGSRPKEQVVIAKCGNDSKRKEDEQDVDEPNSPKSLPSVSMASSSISETKIGSPKNTNTHPINTVFVSRLPNNMTEESVANYFKKYGSIKSVSMPQRWKRRRNRGMAYVSFEDPSVVNIVLKEEHVLEGKSVLVIVSNPREFASTHYRDRQNIDVKDSEDSEMKQLQEDLRQPNSKQVKNKSIVDENCLKYKLEILEQNKNMSRDIMKAAERMSAMLSKNYEDASNLLKDMVSKIDSLQFEELN